MKIYRRFRGISVQKRNSATRTEVPQVANLAIQSLLTDKDMLSCCLTCFNKVVYGEGVEAWKLRNHDFPITKTIAPKGIICSWSVSSIKIVIWKSCTQVIKLK